MLSSNAPLLDKCCLGEGAEDDPKRDIPMIRELLLKGLRRGAPIEH